MLARFASNQPSTKFGLAFATATLALIGLAFGAIRHANAASSMAEWQISFPAFALRIKEKQNEFGPIMQAGSLEQLATFADGGCAKECANLAGFGPVRFRARFKSMEATKQDPRPNYSTDGKVHKSAFLIKLDVEGNVPREDSIMLMIYTAADAIEKWQGLTSDTQIEFTANVNCIARHIFPRDLNFLVTLHDARPIK